MNSRQGTFWSSLYSFLRSSRFGLFLLLILGCVSLLGMFIIQNAPWEEYVSKYGQFWGSFIYFTGLGSVYRIWWFLLLIALAFVNLIFCSTGRLKSSFRQAFSKPKAQDNELLRNAAPTVVTAECGRLSEEMVRHLKNRGFSVDASGDASPRLIAAQKGTFSRIGFLVTHLAIITVMVAGVVNGRLGYRYQRNVGVGESLDVSEIEPSVRFSVRVDDFKVEMTDDGHVRDYKSWLTVVEDGRDVLSKVIEVNHPLSYKGVSFYQASYGQDPTRVRDARFLLLEGDAAVGELIVPFGGRAAVPGTNMELSVTGYVPHFVKDLSTGVVSSRSDEPKLPAVRVDVLEDGSVVESGWLIMGMDVHSREGRLARFHFAAFDPLFYTGLDVASNPGVTLLLIGFALASVGIFLSFFVSWERVWIRIAEEQTNRCELRIAGSSSKDQFRFRSELAGLYELVSGSSNEGKE